MESLSAVKPAPLIAAVAATVVAALITSCGHQTGGRAITVQSAPASTESASRPSSSASAGVTPSSKPPASDEDQARQGILDFQNAYNSQNWEAYTELMCSAMRTQFSGVVMDSVKRGRAQNGPVVIKSVTVTIRGDDATATIDGASEGLGPGTIKMPMKREDGWKVCQVR